mgnify:CR=1 FL=1
MNDVLGYCFAKCQQQFAACLLAEINNVIDESIDYCTKLSRTCETHCLSDKRTSRIAERNWSKVVSFLRSFNTLSQNTIEKNEE